MKDTIRCCISCILPCGALDVIRVVHANGRVQEISGNIKAKEIMKSHPNHVLKKPSSSQSGERICPKIVLISPDTELRRGKIYFLIPVGTEKSSTRSRSRSLTRRKKKVCDQSRQTDVSKNSSSVVGTTNNVVVSSDRYLSDILREKVSTQRDRRRGRVGIWRPHLESIPEQPTED